MLKRVNVILTKADCSFFIMFRKIIVAKMWIHFCDAEIKLTMVYMKHI